MTTSDQAAKPVKRPRGEGQWALGYREPLNPNEQAKKDDNPLNVRARIENIYAKQGFDSIDKQRPARPDALVGPVHPAQAGLRRHLDRRREHRHARGQVLHDAGALRRRRADHRRAAHAGRDLHRVRAATPPTSPTARTSSTTGSRSRTCPEIWDRLDAVGLQTTEACGDCPRVVLGSPLAGESLDEVIDADPGDRRDRHAATSASRSTRTCRASSRPRSRACRTSSTRSTTSRSSASTTPSTAPASTCGSAAGCPPTRCWPSGSAPGCRWTRCPTCGRAWSSVFRDYGYRRLRAKARLKFLIKDWGIEKFRRGARGRVPEAASSSTDPRPSRSSGRSTTSACRSSGTA